MVKYQPHQPIPIEYSDKIYTAIHFHLGDRWGNVNDLLIKSEEEKKIIKFAIPTNWINPIHDVINLLDFRCPGIHVIPYHNGIKTLRIRSPNIPFYPTKIRWIPGFYKRICYQFNGHWKGRQKNPPAEDIPKLTSFLPFEFIQLGRHQSLNEVVRIASESDLFVGVDSGMSHICASVGIPRFIVEYKLNIDAYQRRNPYIKCVGTNDAIAKITKYIEEKYATSF